MSKKTNPSEVSKDNVARKTYEPPKITYTEIEAEEALMGYCKTSAAPGPTGTSCGAPCSVAGS